jgi:phosphotransferase system HPr-like phosphotransfer protein
MRVLGKTLECKVRLNGISDVKEFCKMCSDFYADIDVKSGRYTVDAKSFMGLLSLSLDKPVDVVANFKEERDVDKFKELVKQYII